MVVEAGDVVELLARELEGVLVGGGVLVYQGLAVGDVVHELRDFPVTVRQVGGGAHVVRVEEVEVALGGGVGHVAVARCGVGDVFRLLPHHRWPGHVARRIEVRRRGPAVGHVVVAQRHVGKGRAEYLRLARLPLLRGHARRHALLLVVGLPARLHLHHPFGVVLLPGREVEVVHPVDVVEAARAQLGGYALRSGVVVLGEAAVRHREVGRDVERVALLVVVGDALRRTVHVDRLHGAVAPDGAPAGMVVGIARDVAVVVYREQPVLLVPLHLPVCAVRLYHRRVPVLVIRISSAARAVAHLAHRVGLHSAVKVMQIVRRSN